MVGPAATGQEALAAGGGFHGQAPLAFKMGCRCHARRLYWATPPAQSWMHGGEAEGRFEELPSGPPGPPFPCPPRPSGRGLAPPSPLEVDKDLEGGPPLGAARSKEEAAV